MARRKTQPDIPSTSHQSANQASAQTDVVATPTWMDRHFKTLLLAVCMVSLICRLTILSQYVRDNPLASAPINDAETYWNWAERIAKGEPGQDEPFFSAPLYPYLVGLFRSANGGLYSLYMMQTLMDLATAYLLARVARRRFGARVGLLAAVLFLMLQEPASGALRVLPSSSQLMLVTLVWAVLIWVEQNPTAWRILATGAATGLLCLAYAPALLMVAAMTIWLWLRLGGGKSNVRRALLAPLSSLAVIAPATLNNWNASGEFILIRSGSGITLRQGNHENSTGGYTPIPGVSTHRDRMHEDERRIYREATGKEPTYNAVDAYFRNQAVGFWTANPGRALGLALRKLYWFLTGRNYAEIYQPQAEIDLNVTSRLRLTPLPVAWLMGPALVALGVLLRRPLRHGPEWLFLVAPLFVAVVFWYSPRYRLPAVPILVVLAAWAIERSLQWRRHLLLGSVTASSLAIGVSLGPINAAAGFDRYDPAAAHFHLAYALSKAGRMAEAVDELRAGLKTSPGNRDARKFLGSALLQLGRFEEARTEYAQLGANAPDDLSLILSTASSLLRQHKFDEAEQLLASAMSDAPDQPRLLTALAFVKQLRNQLDESESLYRRSLSLAPDSPATLAGLGQLLTLTRNWPEAKQRLNRALELQPDNFDAHYFLGAIATKEGDVELAKSHYVEALKINPRSGKTLHAVGVLALNTGQLDKAGEWFQWALNVEPDNPKFKQSMLRLQQLRKQRSGK
ncbi:MAG: tetratricopeptide repeat protein [Phycisphaerae bacterium]